MQHIKKLVDADIPNIWWEQHNKQHEATREITIIAVNDWNPENSPDRRILIIYLYKKGMTTAEEADGQNSHLQISLVRIKEAVFANRRS